MTTNSIFAAWEEMRPRLLSIAESRLGRNDAEDAVQEVGLMLFDPECQATSIEVEHGVERWLLHLLQIACNRISRARGKRRERRWLEEDENRARRGEHERQRLVEEAHERLRRATLTACQYTALGLFVEGVNSREIAEQMRISDRMVRYHLGHARERLRDMDVSDLGFRSAEEMFDFCSEVAVYSPPPKNGTGATRRSNARAERALKLEAAQ